MRESPCDIGKPQEDFCDEIASIFDCPDGRYEILDRNLSNDPFEPDIEVMDADEWAFNVICYYVEDSPADGVVEIFPKTFGMRKWVRTIQRGRPFSLSVWEEPPAIQNTSISHVSSTSQTFTSTWTKEGGCSSTG